jgi:tRNA A-37 threonylcarbamoyl transferase component Bud32
VPVGALPRSGPIARFARLAETLSTPRDPRRPWVLALDDRVVKVYDLDAFDELGRARAVLEAETALALSDIEGVVTTYRTGIVGPRLVIEMERLGETVADHLVRVDSRMESALSPETWGRLIDEVARTLARIRGRKMVHRDIKPANLMFDRELSHLVVGDFSISTKLRRRGRGGGIDARGTDRFVAPEAFDGRVGHPADQYALAVTAWDVLGDSVSPATRAVLTRGTAASPDDRYATVEEFGMALRASLDPRSPHRVSSRLERVKPAWRNAWAPAASAAAGVYVLLLAQGTRGLEPTSGLFLPLAVAVATLAGARIAGVYSGKRSQPRLSIAVSPWFPVVLFAAFAALVLSLFDVDDDKTRTYLAYSAVGALALWAALGAIPRDAGQWLVRDVRRWESWRSRRSSSLAAWGSVVVFATVVFAAGAVPYIVSHGRRASPPPTADRAPPVALAAHLRSALLRGDIAAACRLTRIPGASKVAPCSAWAPVVSMWMRRDVGRGGPALGVGDLAATYLTYNEHSETHSGPVWSLHAGSRHGPYVGDLARIDEHGRVWSMSVRRTPADDDPLAVERSLWTFEEVRGPRGWSVSGVEACAESGCTTFSQLTQAKLEGVRKSRYG